MSRVTCPACRASLDVSKVAPGASFDCACGQRMRLPPPAPRTVLVHPEEEEDDDPHATSRMVWNLVVLAAILAPIGVLALAALLRH